jgi:proteasome lid subunit RPN8/RPN11
VHSHPEGGLASEADKRACAGTKVPWHIWSIPDKQWSTIAP